jgi:hypothetical protein
MILNITNFITGISVLTMYNEVLKILFFCFCLAGTLFPSRITNE